MSNLAEKFAINCKSDTPAKSSQYGGKAQAKGHVTAMLDDVRSAHFAAKHRIQRYLNSNDARLAAADLAPSRHETAASESPAPPLLHPRCTYGPGQPGTSQRSPLTAAGAWSVV